MEDTMRYVRIFQLAAIFCLMQIATSTVYGANSKPEKTDVKIAVGGASFMIYLPLALTQNLGYFKDAGLNVEVTDFQSGSKSLQALIGGNVDATAGSFDHTIQMQAKGQHIVAVVEMGRYPGIVLGLVTSKKLNYKSPKDLKGLKIGVTAPGSQTNFMVNYILAKNGLKPDDVSIIGVGGPTTAVAAVKKGEIDALSHADPAITLVERSGELKAIFDTRTTAGTKAVFGGEYPSSVIYVTPEFAAKNPNTTQAMVTAVVRTLRWINKATPAEIAKNMPAEYQGKDPEVYIDIIKRSKAMWPADGRINKAGAENALRVLGAFDKAVSDAKIDVAATYTDKFVDNALAAH
jgi:NitT/TauT family transport system substrate-binding protein